ncbi:MAG: hypothetical protein HKN68_05520 [Saprospiraceae bacterium]|nr:hypothetical protein [Saprospiraceae bacterium]
MQKKYKKEDLTVIWKPELCIHSANCVKNLPGVFKPNDKPWIDVSGGSIAEIKTAIDKCPSGALSYKTNIVMNEQENKNAEIEIIKGGPCVIKSPITIKNVDGSVTEMKRASICRCGQSANKPFCDGSHRGIDFE